jgi:hypothetical protein
MLLFIETALKRLLEDNGNVSSASDANRRNDRVSFGWTAPAFSVEWRRAAGAFSET